MEPSLALLGDLYQCTTPHQGSTPTWSCMEASGSERGLWRRPPESLTERAMLRRSTTTGVGSAPTGAHIASYRQTDKPAAAGRVTVGSSAARPTQVRPAKNA